jgi:hypothetical protein
MAAPLKVTADPAVSRCRCGTKSRAGGSLARREQWWHRAKDSSSERRRCDSRSDDAPRQLQRRIGVRAFGVRDGRRKKGWRTEAASGETLAFSKVMEWHVCCLT